MASLSRYWQNAKALCPRPHRDGLTLPAPLLLRALRPLLDEETLTVEALAFSEHGGTLTIQLRQPACRLVIDFQPLPPDWAHHTLALHWQLHSGQHTGSKLAERALVALLIAALGSAAGAPLHRKLEQQLSGVRIGADTITVALEQIESLQSWLQHPLLQRLTLRDWYCTSSGLRLQLGTRHPADRG